MMVAGGVSSLVFCCSLLGCSEIDALQRQEIKWIVVNGGIQWGGDSPYLTATVENVLVDAFESLPSSERPSGDRSGFDVVATAQCSQRITDTTTFNYILSASGHTAKLEFRLQTSSGIVLQEHVEEVHLIRSLPEFLVSTRFDGLSSAERRQAARVSVSWRYGV
jgi:hypothetical protein